MRARHFRMLRCRDIPRKGDFKQFGCRKEFGRVTSLEHSPTSLDVLVKVSHIKTPRTRAAAVFNVRNQTLLNEIAELPLADCKIFGCLLGLHEPWNDFGDLFMG